VHKNLAGVEILNKILAKYPIILISKLTFVLRLLCLQNTKTKNINRAYWIIFITPFQSAFASPLFRTTLFTI